MTKNASPQWSAVIKSDHADGARSALYQTRAAAAFCMNAERIYRAAEKWRRLECLRFTPRTARAATWMDSKQFFQKTDGFSFLAIVND